MTAVYDTACRLLHAGIIPIPTKGKKPLITDWPNIEITRKTLDAWWASGLWRDNIAVLCGERSGNLVVIDFDGERGYQEFCATFPSLTNTYTVKTGSGAGYHLHYKVELLPNNTDAKNVAVLDNNNIEVRSTGKLVTMPPSIHPDTGNPYTVINTTKAMCLEDMTAVVAWVKALAPATARQHPANLRYDDNLNPRVLDALRTYFQGREKVVKRGDWLNTTCPNPHHKDDNASFGYNTVTGAGNCFYCSNTKFNATTLCEMVGIDIKALGGLFERSNTPGGEIPQVGHEHPTQTVHAKQPVAVNPSTSTTPPAVFITGRDSRQRMTAEVQGVTHALHPPVANSLRFLRKEGVRVFRAGEVLIFASISGGGKTQICELILDKTLRRGGDCIIRSDEWISRETYATDMEMRRVQRMGGPTFHELALHKLWEHEENLYRQWLDEERRNVPMRERKGVNLPESDRDGERLSVEQMELYNRIQADVNQWPGEVYYLLEPGASVEKMIVNVTATYHAAVAKGRRPSVFILDYAQLLWLEEENRGKLWIEQAITKVKDMCRELGLVGIVTSQLNKAETEPVLHGNKDFAPSMMNWLSERQANVVVMFVQELDYAVDQTHENYGKPVTINRNIRNPHTGVSEVVEMQQIKYQIVKNSFAPPGAKGCLDWNAARLRIEDNPALQVQPKPQALPEPTGHQVEGM